MSRFESTNPYIVWPSDPSSDLPNDPKIAYQARLDMIDEVANVLIALNPDLITRKEGQKIRSSALAAKNARLFLQRAFPMDTFSVTTEVGSTYSNLIVEWPHFPSESPDRNQVKRLLSMLANQAYSRQDEGMVYDDDLRREAFRKAFGHVGGLTIQDHSPQPAERAQRAKKEARHLLVLAREAETLNPLVKPRL